jgi:hypothetical protein
MMFFFVNKTIIDKQVCLLIIYLDSEKIVQTVFSKNNNISFSNTINKILRKNVSSVIYIDDHTFTIFEELEFVPATIIGIGKIKIERKSKIPDSIIEHIFESSKIYGETKERKMFKLILDYLPEQLKVKGVNELFNIKHKYSRSRTVLKSLIKSKFFIDHGENLGIIEFEESQKIKMNTKEFFVAFERLIAQIAETQDPELKEEYQISWERLVTEEKTISDAIPNLNFPVDK